VVTNLPHPGSERAHEESELLLEATNLTQIVRLYGLRMWVEQSYKRVKHSLGWSDYQVGSDLAIRRHWQLVCLAFTFCWWAHGRLPTKEPAQKTENDPPADSGGRGKKAEAPASSWQLTWPEALRAVRGWLEPYVMLMRYWKAFCGKPPPPELEALLERVFSGRGLYLYVH
jgi:hypothetical protein